MTNKEAIERIETHMHIHAGKERHAVYITEALEKAIEALLAQEEFELPVCESCGKEIDHINTSIFNYDGSDSDHSIPIQYEHVSGCVTFTTNQNWTDYELTDDERKDGIRCPYCGKYPFDKSVEIELHEPVQVMMWKTHNEPMKEEVK